MKKLLLLLVGIAFVLTSTLTFAASQRYGQSLCSHSDYYCMKVKRGQTWHSMFPNAEQRDVVKRVNRMNIRLRTGMTIAVPKNLDSKDIWDVSPFASKISSTGHKTIVISQKKLAFAAYNSNGHIVHWGPVSTGRNYCKDVGRGCTSPRGTFAMYHKKGAGCVSSKYPINRSKPRAPMPHCMFFHGGYAMHGSPTVPGYRASHGCIRLFNDDARWLNEDFIDTRGNTKVIVLPI